MKKQIALGLVAGVIALASTAFAPTEAQAKDNKQQLNQLAMQMYMQNMANQQNLAAQQQQFYGNQYPYNLNNQNLNNAYLNQLYNNQLANNANFNNGRCNGNGNAFGHYKRKHRHNNNGFFNSANNLLNGNNCANGNNNGYFNNAGYYGNGLINNVGNGIFGNNYNPYNNYGYSQSTVGRLLNRIF